MDKYIARKNKGAAVLNPGTPADNRWCAGRKSELSRVVGLHHALIHSDSIQVPEKREG